MWIYGVPPADPAARAAWETRREALCAAGAQVEAWGADAAGRVDLVSLMPELARREVNELHVEAGATLVGALLDAGLADAWLAYVAPLALGPGRPLAALPPLARVSDAVRWHWHEVTSVGDDLRLRLRRQSPQNAAPCA